MRTAKSKFKGSKLRPILLDELISFVRGARHLVYKKKKVVMSEEHYALLMELEQKLMKLKV